MSPVECKVAIVGVGSPFGDDQLGWQAIEWLMHSGVDKRFSDLQLNFTQADRPGALLLEQLHSADAAIIIDAMRSGAKPGTLQAFSVEQVLSQPTSLVSSHDFGVAQALALGVSLDALPRLLMVLGIEMGNGTLTESTARRLTSTIEEILVSFQSHPLQGG